MKSIIARSLILGGILFLASCKNDDEKITDNPYDTVLEQTLTRESGGQGMDYYLLPEADDFNAIPQDPLNSLTKEKVKLGQLLYHETGLAIAPKQEISKGTYSCASCHHAAAGFQAGRFQGISEGGMGFAHNGLDRVNSPAYADADLDVQPLRSPTTLNSAYQTNMLWNGQFGATGVNVGTEANWKAGTPIETNFLGYEGVEIQAIAGLSVHRMDLDTSLLTDTEYKSLFDAAFKEVPETDRYTKEFMGQAIAAYERTLLANKAPFQRWLRGETEAMTDQQKRGALIFFGKGNCASCHNGPALNNMEFHALGMKDLQDCPEEVFNTLDNDPAHRGRGSFTGNSADDYKFKTPQLYNLKDSPFYGHGSSFRTVKEVVEYKNKGIAENPRVPSNKIDPLFQPLNLSNSDVDDVVAFIEDALYDPNLTRYLPTSLPSGNCFPVNDPQSRIDLGCN